eukprot:6207356-Pleurochrysis_carterae.AAC.4
MMRLSDTCGFLFTAIRQTYAAAVFTCVHATRHVLAHTRGHFIFMCALRADSRAPRTHTRLMLVTEIQRDHFGSSASTEANVDSL